ncbi:MAG: transcription initiation factor IIB [Acidilobaceae archaeon]|nr:transcription initiation factor IIB [Acidilobaceae archaeon]
MGSSLKECPPESVVYDPQRGVRICRDTGEVIEEHIITDEGEWRAYTPEEKMKRARVGGAISFSKPYMGVEAHLGPYREPGNKKIRGLTKRAETLRLQRILKIGRISSSVEKSTSHALNILEDIAAKLDIPESIKEEAARIYREAAHKGLTRGRGTEAMVAATLYIACRLNKIAISLDQIVRVLRNNEVDMKREVSRNYRLLVRDLGIKIPVIEPERFVYSIASSLALPGNVVVEAIRILREAKKRGIPSGKDPSGLAAAAVYIAASKHGFRKTQKEIAQVAGVTEVTVRNRYKEIANALKLEEAAHGE